MSKIVRPLSQRIKTTVQRVRFARAQNKYDQASRENATLLDVVRSDIRRHGFSVISVDDARPLFSYTIGLEAKYGHELIVFALAPVKAHQFLAGIAGLYAKGEAPEIGVRDERINAVLKRCREDASYSHLGLAGFMAKRPVSAVQIVLPDHLGVMPWEPDHQNGYMQADLYSVAQ